MINEKYKAEYQEKFAFIIGINNYKNINSLEYAENDAKSIKEILVKEYDYKDENITMLLGKEANKENILNNYSKFINETCDNDSLLFYYSGHGETYMGIQGNEGFLVPYDGTQENWNTLIGWQEIIEKGNLMKAKHIFYVIDACYSGLALSRGPAFASSRFLTDILSRPARQVLTAGKGDQKVADAKGPIAKHSLFTGYFIKGLQGEAAQENGIITANMLMAYVSNKVGNDSNSFQTPQAGEIFGDGDFVFKGYNNKSNKDNKKNEEQLVKIPSPNDDYLDISNSNINEFKELLSDSKNRIKINEIINNEIKEVISKLIIISEFPNKYDEKTFKDIVLKYNQTINSFMQKLILLVYYGEGLYDSLIKKIIDKLANVNNTNGIEIYIKLQYYPCLIAYYISIISCIESNNIKLLNEILNLNKDIGINRYIDTNNLLVNISSNISEISNYFKVFSPEENYKYPFSEYIYILLQPELDDLLFLGDEYEKDFLNAEILISILNALIRYEFDYDGRVWGTSGRFNYKSRMMNIDIYDFANKLGILEGLGENKEKFVNAYNRFLSHIYF